MKSYSTATVVNYLDSLAIGVKAGLYLESLVHVSELLAEPSQFDIDDSDYATGNSYAGTLEKMVLLGGIEPTTSPLPRGCSTTELQQPERAYALDPL